MTILNFTLPTLKVNEGLLQRSISTIVEYCRCHHLNVSIACDSLYVTIPGGQACMVITL
jgi:hypothetical protein